MSELNIEKVKSIAKLAKLDLSEADLSKLVSELSEVIDYNVAQLSKVDTEQIEPLLNVAGLRNSTREDIPEPGLTQDQALQSASGEHNGFFKVKQILDQS